MPRPRILVVDDEAAVRFGLREFLEARGYEVGEAGDCRTADEAFRAARPDAAVVDYSLPDGNALELLPRLREYDPSVPVVILTAHGSIDLAVRAIKEGAEQFLTKPLEMAALEVVLQRLLESGRDRRNRLAGRSRVARTTVDPFLGTSHAIRELERQARSVLEAQSPVLIQGETGTGKGVLAAWLHAHGPRAEEALVDLNCAGLARDLLESELFGHEKGAFTGAVASKVGLLEVADRGTVFLDEIGDMDPQVQARLLKVLEEKRFHRVGDVKERRVDIRLVAATHRDLARAVREASFRRDLYFRISTLPLLVPPLRERREDIPLLAARLLERVAAELGRGPVALEPEAERALRRHEWPGNIRELRNVLERALLLADRDVLGPEDLRFESVSTPPAADFARAAESSDACLTLLEVERRHIERVLREEGGHVERAAVRLGIPRSTLYQKIKRHGIATSKF